MRDVSVTGRCLPETGTFAAFVRDITERVRRERAMNYRANHDPLTNLPNRRCLLDRLESALAKAGETAGELAAAMVDLHSFKRIQRRPGACRGGQSPGRNRPDPPPVGEGVRHRGPVGGTNSSSCSRTSGMRPMRSSLSPGSRKRCGRSGQSGAGRPSLRRASAWASLPGMDARLKVCSGAPTKPCTGSRTEREVFCPILNEFRGAASRSHPDLRCGGRNGEPDV